MLWSMLLALGLLTVTLSEFGTATALPRCLAHCVLERDTIGLWDLQQGVAFVVFRDEDVGSMGDDWHLFIIRRDPDDALNDSRVSQ